MSVRLSRSLALLLRWTNQEERQAPARQDPWPTGPWTGRPELTQVPRSSHMTSEDGWKGITLTRERPGCQDEDKFFIQNQTKPNQTRSCRRESWSHFARPQLLAEAWLPGVGAQGWGPRAWSSTKAQVQGQLGRGCASLVKRTNPSLGSLPSSPHTLLSPGLRSSLASLLLGPDTPHRDAGGSPSPPNPVSREAPQLISRHPGSFTPWDRGWKHPVLLSRGPSFRNLESLCDFLRACGPGHHPPDPHTVSIRS